MRHQAGGVVGELHGLDALDEIGAERGELLGVRSDLARVLGLEDQELELRGRLVDAVYAVDVEVLEFRHLGLRGTGSRRFRGGRIRAAVRPTWRIALRALLLRRRTYCGHR